MIVNLTDMEGPFSTGAGIRGSNFFAPLLDLLRIRRGTQDENPRFRGAEARGEQPEIDTAAVIMARLEADIGRVHTRFNACAQKIAATSLQIRELALTVDTIARDDLKAQFDTATKACDFFIRNMVEIAQTTLPEKLNSIESLNPPRAATLRAEFLQQDLPKAVDDAIAVYAAAIGDMRRAAPDIVPPQ